MDALRKEYGLSDKFLEYVTGKLRNFILPTEFRNSVKLAKLVTWMRSDSVLDIPPIYGNEYVNSNVLPSELDITQ